MKLMEREHKKQVHFVKERGRAVKRILSHVYNAKKYRRRRIVTKNTQGKVRAVLRNSKRLIPVNEKSIPDKFLPAYQ